MRPAPIEIALQPRYRSAPSGHWPIMVVPYPDEWLPGWLIRFGAANGVPARALGALLGLGSGNWAVNIEFGLSPAIAGAIETASALSTASWLTLVHPITDKALMLAPWVTVSTSPMGRRQATWLQLCPHCLEGDEAPYLRRSWRLATKLICQHHGRRLIDRCPACRQGFAVCDAASLAPFITCTACGQDLRLASAPRLGASTLRAALMLERAGHMADPGDRAKILSLPLDLDPPASRPLTQLSVLMRARSLTFARPRIVALAKTPLPLPQANLQGLVKAYAAIASRPQARPTGERSRPAKT